MYLMCRFCFTGEGKLELLFCIEKSLIQTIKDNLFEVKKKENYKKNLNLKNVFVSYRLKILMAGPLEYVRIVNLN